MRADTAFSIGERARAARTRLGLNQSDVAERVGISPEVYGRFERGKVTPRLTTLLKICEALRVKPNDLLLDEASGSKPEPKPSSEIEQLVAVLEAADAITVRRVTEVARWLRTPPKREAPTVKRTATRRNRKRG